MIEGRPHSIEEVVANSKAILAGWYPGQEGGLAIAEALFGKYNPGGKLACSIARSVGQLPVYYYRRMPYPTPYVDNNDEPRYGFGYGLSYTRFSLRDLEVEAAPSCQDLREGASLHLSVCVRNEGIREGDEVVQLYVQDVESSVSRRVWELKGFERVHLDPGEEKCTHFALTVKDLSVWDIHARETLEPGHIIVRVTNGVDQNLTSIVTLS